MSENELTVLAVFGTRLSIGHDQMQNQRKQDQQDEIEEIGFSRHNTSIDQAVVG
jgi:hypothetical protein